MKRPRILVVDDRPASDPIYEQSLSATEFPAVTFARSPDAARELLNAQPFDLVVAAIRSSVDGIETLRQVRALEPKLPVIMIAERPSPETAATSLRLGAGDYLQESELVESLGRSAKRLLEGRRVGAEHELLRRQVEKPYSFDDIIGTSPGMRKVFDTILQVASSDVDVLVVGDTGTGKELVARSIHKRSSRATGPFVPVDCGAIPDNLLESEFFGHERGAFTGADSRRIGLLEFADGGTFFLDELGELPPILQAKLLRTLQERKIRRVGGREEIDIDVRIVAATARDLDSMIRQGKFRQDLYYRINVVRIDLPPLRQRGDDIGLLAEYFANRHSRETGKGVIGISPEAYQVLAQYPWPGNVRELQNVVRRGLAFTSGRMIGLDDLPDEVIAAAGQRGTGDTLGYFQLRDEHLASFERQFLTDLLTRHSGDVKAAAVEAKLPRGTLYRLMKNHDLDSSRFR